MRENRMESRNKERGREVGGVTWKVIEHEVQPRGAFEVLARGSSVTATDRAHE
jgi:hypothetical protein